jgi:hypothetical protein
MSAWTNFAASIPLLMAARVPEVVSDHFATLAEARADGLFERGWLPDVLPDSTTHLRTSNDLDLNRSTGRFRIAPADVASFAARTVPGAPAVAPLPGWKQVVAGYLDDGFQPHTHSSDGQTWVFFCWAASGECQYVSW